MRFPQGPELTTEGSKPSMIFLKTCEVACHKRGTDIMCGLYLVSKCIHAFWRMHLVQRTLPSHLIASLHHKSHSIAAYPMARRPMGDVQRFIHFVTEPACTHVLCIQALIALEFDSHFCRSPCNAVNVCIASGTSSLSSCKIITNAR